MPAQVFICFNTSGLSCDQMVITWYKFWDEKNVITRQFHFLRFYSQNPLAMDLVLNLPNDGIRLVFDPVTQRLKVYNCRKRYMYILMH